jgi:hypothetical protein
MAFQRSTRHHGALAHIDRSKVPGNFFGTRIACA